MPSGAVAVHAFFFIVCLATPNVITTATKTSPTYSPSRRTPAPEPGPNWQEAKRQWGLIWDLHWIGLGLAYALIACRSLWAIIRSRDVNSYARKRLYHAINWLLVALGITRSLYLWIDPYESGENTIRCPLWIVRPLFGIAFPCLMSSFCLVHVAFLEVAKIKTGLTKLRSIRFIVSIILVHFAVVIVSDTTSAVKADRTELLIVCQSFFIVWGLLNSIAFIYSGSRVVRKAQNIRNKICDKESIKKDDQPNNRHDMVKTHSPKNREAAAKLNKPHLNGGGTNTIQQLGFGNHLTVERAKQKAPKQDRKAASSRIKTNLSRSREHAIHKIIRITLVTSVLSIACCALQIYSLFGVHSIYSEIVSPQPWPWLAFQTSFRLVELSMAYTLSYCVVRPSVFASRRIFTRLFSLIRGTRKREAPRITVVQVKDVAQGYLPQESPL